MLTKNVHLLDAEANRLFLEAMRDEAPQSYVPIIATARGTTKRTETSPIMGDAPAMEELEQHEPIPFTPLMSDVVQATMRRYGAGIAIHEDDWADDQLGAFADAVSDMGREAIALPNALLIAALVNGDTAVGWDGVPFFSASHPARQQQPASWSNTIAGAGTSAANIRAAIDAAIARMGTFRRFNGRQANTNITRLAIIAPYNLRSAVLEAINPNANLTNAASISGITFQVIFDADLDQDDPNDFYIENVGPSLRGLVLWQRSPAMLKAELADSGAHFVDEVRRYKSKWRGVPQYANPQRIIKITNT